jgi:hypothetical protein
VQLEIGIQSFTPVVGELISRRMDTAKTETNLRWLREHTGIHVHADLIVGLPGETPASFRTSFDALWRMQPGEIQIGILKLLPGTPLIRHVVPFAMQFNRETPYDLLASRDFPFVQMQRFKRFARYFEIYVNDGGFVRGLELALMYAPSDSPFDGFLAFSDWLWATTGAEHGIARARQYQLLADYIDHLGAPSEVTDTALATDAVTTGCTSIPSRLHAAAERARRLATAPGVR